MSASRLLGRRGADRVKASLDASGAFSDIDRHRAEKKAQRMPANNGLATRPKLDPDAGFLIGSQDIITNGPTEQDRLRTEECREGMTRDDYGALAEQDRAQVRADRAAAKGRFNSPMPAAQPKAEKPLPEPKAAPKPQPLAPAPAPATIGIATAHPATVSMLPRAKVATSPKAVEPEPERSSIRIAPDNRQLVTLSLSVPEDPEIAAIATATTVLDTLSPAALQRVFAYLASRFTMPLDGPR